MSTENALRRTKRRYAHELYPSATEDAVRPLAVEVPHLYARALGFGIFGTSWHEVEPRSIGGDRVMHMIAARQIAFLADAMHQGLTGEEAWAWADQRTDDETGEWVWERAVHYGVAPDAIKPYPCGPEPEPHRHIGQPFHAEKWGAGPESECIDCTESVALGLTADESAEVARFGLDVPESTDPKESI